MKEAAEITVIWNTFLNEIIESILIFNSNKIKTRAMIISRRRSKLAKGRRWMNKGIRDRLKVIDSRGTSWHRLVKRGITSHHKHRKRFSSLTLFKNLFICHLSVNMLSVTMYLSKPLQSKNVTKVIRKKWISISQFLAEQIDSKIEETRSITNHDLPKIWEVTRDLWKLEDSD